MTGETNRTKSSGVAFFAKPSGPDRADLRGHFGVNDREHLSHIRSDRMEDESISLLPVVLVWNGCSFDLASSVGLNGGRLHVADRHRGNRSIAWGEIPQEAHQKTVRDQ